MRHIAVITGSRAEYGLLYWLMDGLRADKDVKLSVIATGMHTLTQFGNTLDIIRKDGFEPIVVPMDMPGDGGIDMAKAIASVTAGMAEALEKLNPDIVVLLGDRFEIMAAAQAALCLKLPVAHIHGGELTEGSMDESMRHAISKLSHVHFVAADEFRNRVIQLGENPDNVHVVGAVGIENLFRQDIPARAGLEQSIGMPLREPSFIVTYHPATLDGADPATQAQMLCDALDAFPDASVILTGSNADAGGRRMMAVYEAYAQKHPGRVVYTPSLGIRHYLAALKTCSVVIGNSSSGLIEAPSAGIPTVNIGDRQKSRPTPPSVTSCPADKDAIVAAIQKALTPDMKTLAAKKQNLYFASERPSERMINILKTVSLDNLVRKPFFDVKHG